MLLSLLFFSRKAFRSRNKNGYQEGKEFSFQERPQFITWPVGETAPKNLLLVVQIAANIAVNSKCLNSKEAFSKFFFYLSMGKLIHCNPPAGRIV